MIISQIIGGLGNQMFQYASGRALSLSEGAPLKLDLSAYAGYELHNGFEIDRVFEAPINIASRDDVRGMLGWRAGYMTRRVLKRLPFPGLRGAPLSIEPHFNFWPGLRSGGGPRYLMGYWQSEKYFKDFESEIRADFKFRTPLAGANWELAESFQRGQSVSLHIRRGDYVTHAPTTKVLNVCSLEYYYRAISWMAERVSSPHFFVFSDEPQWVRDNIEIPFPVEYVDHNRGSDSYIDMQLMSLCQHHIIANSSFSWWGAWLNPNPDKFVVAPKEWFRADLDDRDLIPGDWVRL